MSATRARVRLLGLFAALLATVIHGSKDVRVLVAVTSSHDRLGDQTAKALQTWLHPSHGCTIDGVSVEVKYFVGSAGEVVDGATAVSETPGDGFSTVELGQVRDSEYPPQVKTMRLYEHLGVGEDFDFVLRVDDDAYISLSNLATLVLQLVTKHRVDSARDAVYLGHPGLGRKDEVGKLGLTAPYCLGGPGELTTSRTVGLLLPAVKDILATRDFRSAHSDSEVGRLIHRQAGIGCGSITRPVLRTGRPGIARTVPVIAISPVPRRRLQDHLFRQLYGTNDPSPLSASLHDRARWGELVTAHPVLKSDVVTVRRFHRRVAGQGLVPLPLVLFEPGEKKSAPDGACVHNPQTQLFATACGADAKELLEGGAFVFFPDRCSVSVPECPSPRHRSEPFPSPPVFRVLSLDTAEEASRVLSLQSRAAEHGVTVRRVFGVDGRGLGASGLESFLPHPTLRPGEIGYRESMRRVISDAKERGDQMVGVFDSDVFLADDFGGQLRDLLASDRCGGHLYTGGEGQGGVLMLGTSQWGDGRVWDLVREELVAQDKEGDMLCFNAFPQSVGSFAVVYHRSTFDAILEWLDLPSFVDKPFDHVLQYLALEGFVVRVASGTLVVPSLLHTSTVNPERRGSTSVLERACKHKWDLTKVPEYRAWLEASGAGDWSLATCVQGKMWSNEGVCQDDDADIMSRSFQLFQRSYSCADAEKYCFDTRLGSYVRRACPATCGGCELTGGLGSRWCGFDNEDGLHRFLGKSNEGPLSRCADYVDACRDSEEGGGVAQRFCPCTCMHARARLKGGKT